MIISNVRLQRYGEGQGLSWSAMRLSNALGSMKTVVLETGVASDQKGLFYAVEDHLPFGGLNPLRGRNIDSQGVRFPDQSDNYTSQLTDSAVTLFETNGLTIHRTNALFVATARPEIYGEALQLVARGMECNLICQRGIPAVMIGRHSLSSDERRKALMIVWAGSSCISQEYEQPPQIPFFKHFLLSILDS